MCDETTCLVMQFRWHFSIHIFNMKVVILNTIYCFEIINVNLICFIVGWQNIKIITVLWSVTWVVRQKNHERLNQGFMINFVYERFHSANFFLIILKLFFKFKNKNETYSMHETAMRLTGLWKAIQMLQKSILIGSQYTLLLCTHSHATVIRFDNRCFLEF